MNKRIATVTGANRGIGLEISRQLAVNDIRVVMTSRDVDKGKEAQEYITEMGHEVDYFPLDVGCQESIISFRDYVRERYGRLDILVNNAGVLDQNDRVEASILEQEISRFEWTMEVNFYGVLRVCQILVPLIRTSESGRIVNVSSRLGLLSEMKDQYPAYGISKTALNALTKMLADATSGDGVLVNAMSPGLVATDMGGPHGRPVEEGADTAVWLALLPDGGPTGVFFFDRQKVDW